MPDAETSLAYLCVALLVLSAARSAVEVEVIRSQGSATAALHGW